jgi:hypothetical protein
MDVKESEYFIKEGSRQLPFIPPLWEISLSKHTASHLFDHEAYRSIVIVCSVISAFMERLSSPAHQARASAHV